jgi:8-oxo-dGTP pyrophosphatase MutT (NUDIX family)
MRKGFLSGLIFTTALAGCASQPLYEASNGGFKGAGCYLETPEGIVLAVNRGWNKTKQQSLQFPVGTREKGETPEQTARREVREELGVAAEDITIGPLLENLNTPEKPVYLFQCAVKGIRHAGDVEGLAPIDTGESLGAIVVNPDTGTYQSGVKAGQPVDMPTRFKGDMERMQRLFPLDIKLNN